jgi:hypothetical protein
MQQVKKINSSLFKSIIIDIKVDDLIVAKIDDLEECIIKLSIKNNIESDINKHLLASNRYEVDLNIIDEILHISYVKKEIILINNIDYFETIGVIILIPKNTPYKKIITNE